MAAESSRFIPDHPFLYGLPLTTESGRSDALCRCSNIINMVAAAILMDAGESFFCDPSVRDGVAWTLNGVGNVLDALRAALEAEQLPRRTGEGEE